MLETARPQVADAIAVRLDRSHVFASIGLLQDGLHIRVYLRVLGRKLDPLPCMEHGCAYLVDLIV